VPPRAIAHRGDWRECRENTLAAFAAAARAGADMIEVDVRRTSDGAAAIVHDATLDRVWGVPGAVAELTLDALRQVGEIPTLPEVLGAIDLPVMIDFEQADVVEPALEAVVAADALDRVVFAGGNVQGHRRVRALAPRARIAFSWTGDAAPKAVFDELAAEFSNPCFEHVDERLVAETHARGLRLSTWTVDDVQTMAHLLDLGVDAVITNEIGSLVALLGDREAAARC